MIEKRGPHIPRTTPTCQRCVAWAREHSAKLSFFHGGVEYWQCERCGHMWSERQGRPHLRTVHR